MIVYADFSCPYSYVASHRVDALAEVGVRVQWRAIEREPSLPVSGRPLSGGGELASQLSEPLRPGERPPWRMPGFVPNTEAAVSGYAEACGAGVAEQVRRVLFDAYWVHGADIGSAEVLRRLLAGPIQRGHSTSFPLHDFGYAVSPSRGPITTKAWRRIRHWRAGWAALNLTRTPGLIADGGEILCGAAAVDYLGEQVIHLGAPVNPVLPDPMSYTVRPTHPVWW
jgi:hypothetical protein